jgi:predicted transcriptional regulator
MEDKEHIQLQEAKELLAKLTAAEMASSREVTRLKDKVKQVYGELQIVSEDLENQWETLQELRRQIEGVLDLVKEKADA